MGFVPFYCFVFFLVVILNLSAFELEETSCTMPLQPQEYAKT